MTLDCSTVASSSVLFKVNKHISAPQVRAESLVSTAGFYRPSVFTPLQLEDPFLFKQDFFFFISSSVACTCLKGHLSVILKYAGEAP